MTTSIQGRIATAIGRTIPGPLGRAILNRRLIPPTHLHHVGEGDFETVGSNYLAYFVKLCALVPADRVLDVGSGTGRIARPLTRFLKGGTYCGVEIVKDSVAWCQHVYHRYPNFEFLHADVRNSVYNPSGRFAAAEYGFPFKDRTFTFAVLTSVFTHMLRRDVEHYLTEMSRVLEPGGRVFATFFLLDREARECLERGISAVTFPHAADGCWLRMVDAPEAAVAYGEPDVLEMCARAGLPATCLRHGTWSGRTEGMDWQDVVVLRKRG